MDRAKNKTCIITGAALGIGRACALRLASEGARIAIFDVHDDEGEALAKELRDSGASARFWQVDVTREADVKAAIDAAAQLELSVCIAVCDSGGNPVASARMDGAPILSLEIAVSQVWT